VDRIAEKSKKQLKQENMGMIKEGSSALLADLGDGVLGLLFTADAHFLDSDAFAMIDLAISQLDQSFIGLVMTHQGDHFCLNFDLSNLLKASDEKNWERIENLIKGTQDLYLRFRYHPKPVIASSFGNTLALGAELAMAADRICASEDIALGLNHIHLGLIPAGGGCLESIKRLVSKNMKMDRSDTLPFLHLAFENIAGAKVSDNGIMAREMGFLTDHDVLIKDREHLLSDAKGMILDMFQKGYSPPDKKDLAYALGARGTAFLKMSSQTMFWSDYISEYDLHVAGKLAYVLSGGPLSAPQWVDEQYFLDLEREVFLSLCGEEKTLERMRHMMKTGKVLRN
jgi:3-hydroxyacyl-CoA dehydrogenase